MYKVNSSSLLLVEDLIGRTLEVKSYQQSPFEKEITHRLISIQSTLQDLIARAIQEHTWNRDMNVPETILFGDYEIGQMNWATQCAARVVDSVNRTPDLSPDFIENTKTIHAMLNTVAKNEVNLASLIGFESVFKEIFIESKKLNLKNKPDIEVLRRIFDVYRGIDGLMSKYLPLDYQLDEIFQEFTDEEVTPPDIVLAPAPLVLKAFNEMRWDLAEISALYKAEGIELSERLVELLDSILKTLNQII